VCLAKALTESGIPCGHESIFDHRGIEQAIKVCEGKDEAGLSFCSTRRYVDGKWCEDAPYVNSKEIQAESSYMAAPFLTHQLLKETPIIHLVRHPNKVVDSFVNHVGNFKNSYPSGEYTSIYEEFIYKYVPELTETLSPFDRAALYYVRWNQMIEKCGRSFFHRVEDSLELLEPVLGIPLKKIKEKNINTMKSGYSPVFHPGKLESPAVREEFISMGKRYGYDMGVGYFL
jgi:hypothetical protein